jgi:uncharacterized membrane protein
MSNAQHALTNRDRVEIAVGSAVLAFPVATTEEVWNLSIELSWLRIAAISLIVVSLFVSLVSDFTVAVKRTVLVAFPASFSATVVDSLS